MFSNVLAIILVILAGKNAFPQQHADADAVKTCTFDGIYRKDGWTIPGMPAKQADVKYPRKPYSNMPGVFGTMLTPVNPETTYTRIGCSRDNSGWLQIDEQPIAIIWLFSFDFEGRVFAYGIRFGLERIENGVRRDAGMESALVFYDLDGSGHFALKKSAGLPFPDFMPDWVKKGADASPRK
jgi:hypothetical protein